MSDTLGLQGCDCERVNGICSSYYHRYFPSAEDDKLIDEIGEPFSEGEDEELDEHVGEGEEGEEEEEEDDDEIEEEDEEDLSADEDSLLRHRYGRGDSDDNAGGGARGGGGGVGVIGQSEQTKDVSNVGVTGDRGVENRDGSNKKIGEKDRLSPLTCSSSDEEEMLQSIPPLPDSDTDSDGKILKVGFAVVSLSDNAF